MHSIPKILEQPRLLAMTALTLAQTSQDAKQFSESLRYLKEAAQLRPTSLNLIDGWQRSINFGREVDATAEQNQADRLARP